MLSVNAATTNQCSRLLVAVKPRCSLLPLLREPNPVDAVGDSATWEIPGNARKAAPLSFLPPPFASFSFSPPLPSSSSTSLFPLQGCSSFFHKSCLPFPFPVLVAVQSLSRSVVKRWARRKEGRAERRSIRENWLDFRLCRPL